MIGRCNVIAGDVIGIDGEGKGWGWVPVQEDREWITRNVIVMQVRGGWSHEGRPLMASQCATGEDSL